MNKLRIFIISTAILFSASCHSQNDTKKQSTSVLIHTDIGDITIKLYDETPGHRDNFLKLVNKKFFDDLLFHRVIKDFMIQGGDPDSKNASQGTLLGNGGPGYNLPAEFNPKLIHKHGALAAARESDEINPKKESSGSQFYIVQGKIFTDEELNIMEQQMNMAKHQEIIYKYILLPENEKLRHKIDTLQKTQNIPELEKLSKELEELTIDEYNKVPKFTFSDNQRKIYTTIGGTPHLDGNYTVFGEVIDGIETLDKIASVQTDKNNRPLKDIKMKIISTLTD
ncbi:MAG: peptidylprolyl isomerase [Bacteroidia bacterium]|nr:peptidylprolyl isomerase [Bacteroidia bacterium]